MAKLLDKPIDEIHIMSSVLGQVQDFIKKHIAILTYEGMGKTEPVMNTQLDVLKDLENESEVKIKAKPGVKEARKQELKEREREELIHKGQPLVDFFDLKEGKRIDDLKPEEFRALFCRVWLEALSRGVLVEILSSSGYSGELTKKIVI
jgi:hypothetical protein